MDPFALLLVVLLIWGPSMGQVPNSACYVVDYEMRQHRACKPEETR